MVSFLCSSGVFVSWYEYNFSWLAYFPFVDDDDDDDDEDDDEEEEEDDDDDE